MTKMKWPTKKTLLTTLWIADWNGPCSCTLDCKHWTSPRNGGR